jgi:hypothetical protein
VAKPEDAFEQRIADLVASLKRTGVVTGTAGTKVVVTVQGVSMTLPRLASYTPTISDSVIVQGPAPYIVIGKAA